MKSLNDIIWNGDVNLEEGKEKDVIELGMKDICLVDSCSIRPQCTVCPPYYGIICIK